MRVLLTLLIAAAFGFSVSAQSESCTAVYINAAVLDLQNAVLTLQIAAASDDASAVLSALATMRVIMADLESLCSAAPPLTFSGDGQQVIGPFTIPAGVYRVTSTCTGYCYPMLERLDGDCGSMANGTFLPQISHGGGTGTEVFRSGGCTVLLEGEGEGWEIAFTLLE